MMFATAFKVLGRLAPALIIALLLTGFAEASTNHEYHRLSRKHRGSSLIFSQSVSGLHTQLQRSSDQSDDQKVPGVVNGFALESGVMVEALSFAQFGMSLRHADRSGGGVSLVGQELRGRAGISLGSPVFDLGVAAGYALSREQFDVVSQNQIQSAQGTGSGWFYLVEVTRHLGSQFSLGASYERSQLESSLDTGSLARVEDALGLSLRFWF